MTCCHNNKNCHLSYLDETTHSFDGKDWCLFHLPFEDKEGNESIKSSYDENESAEFTKKIIQYINDRNSIHQGSNLSHVYFPGEINLYLMIPALDLSGSVFRGPASFSNLTIDESKLKNIKGEPHVPTSFAHVMFYDRCVFYDAKIITTRKVSFEKCLFSMFFNFDRSVFTSDVSFKDSEIKCDAQFRNTVFLGDLSLENVIIDGDLKFQYLIDKDSEEINPRIRLFEGSNIKIKGEALFTNRQFIGNVNFTGAEFNIAPDFCGCSLHESIIFPEAINFKDTQSLLSSARYRVLRNSMSNIKAHREEGMFFALEQTSLQNNNQIAKTDKLFSKAYRLTSNYGESALRPLIILSILYVIFAIAYSLIISPVIDFESNIDWALVRQSFEFSFSQITQPFSIFSLKMQSVSNQFLDGSLWIKVLAPIQSLLSISCLALFILSLRWKFKKG